MSRLHWSFALLAAVVAGVCNGLGAPHGLAWIVGAGAAAAVGLGASLGEGFFRRER